MRENDPAAKTMMVAYPRSLVLSEGGGEQRSPHRNLSYKLVIFTQTWHIFRVRLFGRVSGTERKDQKIFFLKKKSFLFKKANTGVL